MQLHTISGIKRARKKRIGRGGKRGTTSGRGTKGQRSRAGRRIRPALRDLIIRLPKHRGFRNKPLTAKPLAVDFAALIRKAAARGNGALVIDCAFLRAAGLVPAGYRGKVKVLNGAKPPDAPRIAQALTLKGVAASKSVAVLIEQAGGKVE